MQEEDRMQKEFLGREFLLDNEPAKAAYAAAEKMPIFDWHCHLSPKEIYENAAPSDLAALWLGGDHYKWRAMRSCGVPERLITGDAPGEEKFRAFAACMPDLIGNPMYHWVHLELRRYFGVDEILNAASADAIWRKTCEAIAAGDYRPRALIERSNVTHLCTTDDPADSLEYHQLLAKDPSFSCRVLPAFRPDQALAVEQPGWAAWLMKLEARIGCQIDSFEALCGALSERIAFFASLGCRASDHGFAYVPYAPAEPDRVEKIFAAARRVESIDALAADQFKTALLRFLAAEYARRGWGMELHIGPMRNNNAKMFRAIGPDTGYDSIGDWPVALQLSRFLDSLAAEDALPRTILFALNPRDNYVLGSMIGNFQTDEAESKLQFGSAWWFNDNIDGMRAQLAALANLGALGKFVGMVTDSRSFLSYPRHEYFRRVLCGFLGDLVAQGQYPDDPATLQTLAENISYRNAIRYFGVE